MSIGPRNHRPVVTAPCGSGALWERRPRRDGLLDCYD